METGYRTQQFHWSSLSFKNFLEMAHLIPKYKGQPFPVPINGKNVEIIDMKFEDYPDVELKKKLLAMNAKFYGQIPNASNYLVFDGNTLEVSQNKPQNGEYIELPSNWFDYTLCVNTDGTTKEPTR